MKNHNFSQSKLGNLLLLLSSNQQKNLIQWLEVPLKKYPKKLIPLYKIILKDAPNFESASLSKDLLYKKLYPGKKLNEGTIKNLFSELIIAMEDFLRYEQFLSNEHSQNKMLIEGYRNLGETEKVIDLLEQQISDLSGSELEDPDQFFTLYDYQVAHFDLMRKRTSLEKSKPMLEKSIQYLNEGYALYLVRLIAAKKQRQNVHGNENYKLDTEIEFLEFINEGLNSTIINIYLTYIRQEKPTKNQTLQLIQQYKNNLNHINKEDKRNIFYLLFNNFSYLYDHEIIDVHMMLDYYKFGLKGNIITQNKKLNLITYANIINTSNVAKQFDFTQDFINTYTPYLSKSFQSDAKLYAESHMLYKKGELQACLDKCANYHFKESYITWRLQITLLQAYFDLFLINRSYFELLQNFANAYEKRVRRNNALSDAKAEIYLKSIRFARNITATIYKNDHKRLSQLIQKLQSEIGIFGHLWWREKVPTLQELINKQ